MDDTTRLHWEQIADATIDRAIAATISELEEAPFISEEVENSADLHDRLLRWFKS